MNQEIYDRLDEAKRNLEELQSAVAKMSNALYPMDRESRISDVMTAAGVFTSVHLNNTVSAIDDALDELDRLKSENKKLEHHITELEG